MALYRWRAIGIILLVFAWRKLPFARALSTCAPACAAAAFVFTLGRALCQHGSAPIHVSGLTKHRRNGAEGLRTKRPSRQSKGQFFPGDGFICRDRISRIVRMIEIFLKFFLKEKILNNRVWEISHKFEYLNGSKSKQIKKLVRFVNVQWSQKWFLSSIAKKFNKKYRKLAK